MSLLTAYFHGVVTNVIGAWLSHWVAPQPLHCHCTGSAAEPGLIELLQSQLNRCGPSDLAPVCASCLVCPAPGWGTGDVLLAGLVGLIIGAAFTTCWAGGGLPVRRLAAPAWTAQGGGIIETPGPIAMQIVDSAPPGPVKGKGKPGVIVQA